MHGDPTATTPPLPVPPATVETPTFFTVTTNGSVHVRAGLAEAAATTLLGLEGEQAAIANTLLLRWTAWCGLAVRESEATAMDEFADERLCQRCLRAVPAAWRPLLFRHAV